MPTRLTYHPGNHTYWLADPDGKRRRIPSVTALKKTLHHFDGEHWYLRETAAAAADAWETISAEPPAYREDLIRAAAARRIAEPRLHGTAVHDYAHHLWTGDPIDVPDQWATWVENLADWWQRNQLQHLHSETLCWADHDEHCHPYAGTYDLMARHPDRGVGIIDLKTYSPTSAGTARLAEWAMQLAAYSLTDYHVLDGDDQPMPPIDWLAVVHVGPHTWDEYLLTGQDRAAAEQQVLTALDLKAIPKPSMERTA
jgi:hypothetical protein